MKIIGKDNLDRDHVSDELVCENVNEIIGRKIVAWLNEWSGDNGSRFYELVADDHKLYAWEP